MKERGELEAQLNELKESFAKEREELIAVQKAEMEKQFKSFMKVNFYLVFLIFLS